jgi:HTH-type transcriptional regulator/antitoxin HigA
MNNYNIKPIKTEKDNEAALARVDELWEAMPSTPEGDELEVITLLIEVFEKDFYKIDGPDPIEAIKFRMEQQNLADKDLVPFIGQRSHVSEVLRRKRRLSLSMIRKLSKGLNIPLESLVAEYPIDNVA